MWPEQLISMADACMRVFVFVFVCMNVCGAIHAQQLNVNDDVFMVVFWQSEYSAAFHAIHFSILLTVVFAVHLLLFFLFVGILCACECVRPHMCRLLCHGRTDGRWVCLLGHYKQCIGTDRIVYKCVWLFGWYWLWACANLCVYWPLEILYKDRFTPVPQ